MNLLKEISIISTESLQTGYHANIIVIFGVGANASWFIHYLDGKTPIEMVVDNDTRKQGHTVNTYMKYNKGELRNEIVMNPEILRQYDPESIIVTVASVHYTEIAEQLHGYGIKKVFWIKTIKEHTEENGDADNPAKKYIYYPISRYKVFIQMGTYGGHGKYISEQLLKSDIDIDIVWGVKNAKSEVPDGIRIVYEGNIDDYYKELETCHVAIFDSRLPEYAIKRANQYYIQVKHWGSITLKKFFLDEKLMYQDEHLRNIALRDSEVTDYIFSGSEFDEKSCRSGFAFKGKFIRVGSARSDAMFDKALYDKVRNYYKIPQNARIVLYAPTFRYLSSEQNVSKVGDANLDYNRLLSALEKRTGDDWYVLLRFHPSVAIESEKMGFTDRVINASLYDDSQELASASDLMITDYSSIMFEPAYVGKPVILYAYDKSSYVNKERDLLLDYDSLPFPCAENNDELEEIIKKFNQEKYQSDVKDFLLKYGVNEDGHASEQAAKFICSII